MQFCVPMHWMPAALGCLLNQLSNSLPTREGLTGLIILVQHLPLHILMSLVSENVPDDT